MSTSASSNAPASADRRNVPLGFVSLTENLMMVAMAVWMGLMLV